MEAEAQELPDVLLSYQKALLAATSMHQVVLCEKSRRIGMTWGIAADGVLTAGADRKEGGMNVFYMGYEKEMTREFIDVCAMWARRFGFAAGEMSEFLFEDQDEAGQEKHIKAFRITFASGFEIVALCSKPRSLRGKQGFVILDEAAFHDDLFQVVKAAVALLMWGGKLLIISTHNGDENPFNKMIAEVKAKRLKYHHIKVTFRDALDAGLYKRICEVSGTGWSAEAQANWEAEIRARFPNDTDAEELDCIPSNSAGKYLSRVLLESRSEPAPLLKLSLKDDFVHRSDESRATEIGEWIEENLKPALAAHSGEGPIFVGEDFGRTGDLSVQWGYQVRTDLRRQCVIVIELRNVPFREQEQILMALCEGVPRFSGVALDARGNGQYLAERAVQRFGASKVRQVMITSGFYAEWWPRYRAALEDDKATIPESRDIVDDFRLVEVVKGIPVVVGRTNQNGEQRHGDSAIAGLLAYYATEDIEAGDIEVSAYGRETTGLDAFGSENDRGIPEGFYS